MSTTEESTNDQRVIFIVAALMFLAIPIRIPDPESRTQKEFKNFIITFNKTFQGNSSEYQKRYQVFKNTFEMLEDLRHDNRPIFGKNRNSDFGGIRFVSKDRQRNESRSKRQILEVLFTENQKRRGSMLPQYVDWRKRGIITPIRNQDANGSSSAKSVIATIEAMLALQRNSTVTDGLSVQQILDCAKQSTIGNQCQLLEWLRTENMTILPARNYSNCLTASSIRKPSVTDFSCSSFIDQETEMLIHLATKGPLIASVNALPSQQNFDNVIQHGCNNKTSRQAVQIVGYNLGGQEEPYFIVRTSWGIASGPRRGYAKVAIGGNVCGIAEEVASVKV